MFLSPLLRRLTPLLGLLALTAAPPALAGNETIVHRAQALIEPTRKAVLSAQIASRIIEITVDEGDTFKAKQTLVRFDCALPRAKMRRAEAVLNVAKKHHRANQRMAELSGISELEVILSEAKVKKARAELGIIAVEVDRCRIRAPFSGRVVKRHVDPFDSVDTEDPLLAIREDGPLRTRLVVPAAWIGWLKVGQPFEVRVAETGKTYPARVEALAANVDPGSQTLSVRGAILGRFPELLPGLGGSARFPGRDRTP